MRLSLQWGAMSAVSSSLARKFDFLQERAKRRPLIEEVPNDGSTGGAALRKANIEHLKEFYLDRLAKRDPNVAARLGAGMQARRALPTRMDASAVAQPQASGQHVQQHSRPSFAPSSGACGTSSAAVVDVEDLEIMCNNCFNLIKSADAATCSGDPGSCPTAIRMAKGVAAGELPTGPVALLDLKLQKLRVALEERLQASSSNVPLMRHLMQLRLHIDTTIKWAPGTTEIGVLSDHTVQQVKSLTVTSRVLAPAVYIFSKRVENVVTQKERELRRQQAQVAEASAAKDGCGGGYGGYGGCASAFAARMEVARSEPSESVADVNSVVSELDSDCGTRYTETVVTQDGPGSTDVGNVQDANDYLALPTEDEQRRWFYQQCLTLKLACPDKARARKLLITDLYARVRAETVPIENWIQWVRAQLMPDGSEASPAFQPEPRKTSGSQRGFPHT